MHVKVFSSLDKLRESWLTLQQQGVFYIFQSIQWIDVWLQTAGKGLKEELFILAVSQTENDPPFMIIPLSIYKKNGIRYLGSLGGGHTDFAGAVLQNNAQSLYSTELLWENIIKKARLNRVDIIRIRKIPSMIENIPNPLFSSLCVHEEMNYAINLKTTWEKYYSSKIKTKIKSDLKRRKKLLTEQGVVKFYVAENKDEKNRLTKVMISQKTKRYQYKNIKNQFELADNIDLYIQVTDKLPTSHLSALMLNDIVLAVHWGIVFDGRFYHIMPAHDEKYGKYAPGKILLMHLIEWSFQNKLSYFDFTCGNEIYKKDFANVENILYEFNKPISLKGKIYFDFRNKLGELKERMKTNKSLSETNS